ncbi:urease accessory protein UreD [Parendozoicomonas haliclonae]|uniref:Urease accessory protein UreD n=1 Tax=Parendozoicomonas haliclonae TaxID=1960125 RepID=A0A1X7AH41_9GAMM|nr:urease accessory protein UreD [Parendozoicomonas haliclonae]SMA41663.1 Urease accessory protein UreD [Parendozoicomonas haliclonae]
MTEALKQAYQNWRAYLEVSVERYKQQSILGKTRHYGPLRLQRPFYPEGQDLAHLYILHPPGGLVAGDELVQQIKVQPNAAGLVTTPAAGKVYYNKASDSQIQRVDITVARGGSLEWLPQETILFEGCRAELHTRIKLEADAAFIGWDIFCLGRQASGEGFDHGQMLQTVEVSRSGKPLFIERLHLEPGDDRLGNLLGLNGGRVFGSMIVTLAEEVELSEWHEQLYEAGFAAEVAMTYRNGLLLVRYLGQSSSRARTVFERVWGWCRPLVNGRDACRPRIWNT